MKCVPITISVPKDMAAKLRVLAKRQDRPVSRVVCEALRKLLKEKRK